MIIFSKNINKFKHVCVRKKKLGICISRGRKLNKMNEKNYVRSKVNKTDESCHLVDLFLLLGR